MSKPQPWDRRAEMKERRSLACDLGAGLNSAIVVAEQRVLPDAKLVEAWRRIVRSQLDKL